MLHKMVFVSVWNHSNMSMGKGFECFLPVWYVYFLLMYTLYLSHRNEWQCLSTHEVENGNLSGGCISELRNKNHFNNLWNSDIHDNRLLLLNSVQVKGRDRESWHSFIHFRRLLMSLNLRWYYNHSN